LGALRGVSYKGDIKIERILNIKNSLFVVYFLDKRQRMAVYGAILYPEWVIYAYQAVMPVIKKQKPSSVGWRASE
jgi:hypothetical protein